MKPADLRIFCLALGFTAVVVKGHEDMDDGASRARNFAHLIEAFCTHVPADFETANQNDVGLLDRALDRIKAALADDGVADLHYSRASLFQFYDRLRARYAVYASDDMVADRVLELLEAEIAHDATQGEMH